MRTAETWLRMMHPFAKKDPPPCPLPDYRERVKREEAFQLGNTRRGGPKFQGVSWKRATSCEAISREKSVVVSPRSE